MDDKAVALLSAGVAVFAAAASVCFSVLSLRAQARALRLQHAGVVGQYFGELRAWADEACNVLSDAVHLCRLDPAQCEPPSFFERRHGVRVKLSALVDRGRWFFPNVTQDERDQDDRDADELPAFLGRRPDVLNYLVKAYRLVNGLDCQEHAPNHQVREDLRSAQRGFVNEVQRFLDPQAREAEFADLTARPGWGQDSPTRGQSKQTP
jgi:hypothetical protein